MVADMGSSVGLYTGVQAVVSKRKKFCPHQCADHSYTWFFIGECRIFCQQCHVPVCGRFIWSRCFQATHFFYQSKEKWKKLCTTIVSLYWKPWRAACPVIFQRQG